MLQEYVARLGVPVEHELVRALIPAIATLRTAADVLDERPRPSSLCIWRTTHAAAQRLRAAATAWMSPSYAVPLPVTTQ